MAKSFIYENLPDVSTPQGMIFYSFIMYVVSYFLSWFFKGPEEEQDPRVKGDKDVKTRTKAELELIREKGRLKREENK